MSILHPNFDFKVKFRFETLVKNQNFTQKFNQKSKFSSKIGIFAKLFKRFRYIRGRTVRTLVIIRLVLLSWWWCSRFGVVEYLLDRARTHHATPLSKLYDTNTIIIITYTITLDYTTTKGQCAHFFSF